MTSATTRPSRREQRREQTREEIKTLAMEQVAAGGPDAVSLKGIARTMAMSPAAIYRYFDNREALLADVVVDAYDSLADALDAAGARPGTPVERFTAVASACRAWALAQPNAYRLIFQTTSGSGQDLAPDRTIPAASRSMGVLLDSLAALAPAGTTAGSDADGDPDGSRLLEQLRAWAERDAMPLGVLALGLTCWTRLHGVISLELGHHLASVGIDPALLYDAEVTTLIRQAQHPGTGEFRPVDDGT
ncbi:TetR/AcrR family transcriptional regulator [Cellulomonas sp. KRMCY2]|uniref:TetR/AcrR family transcriptional regulator n=1 Tax=Cellulomonas sp. KRMCY2 TaxID=1304865 RepID=UPI00045E77FD|nr:TetR/AcrR family transcriptional regulator [Cellulomonas sp. KRMCY2]